ncbi:unnamed protein product [Gordionus sp. m RMFG-2023]
MTYISRDGRILESQSPMTLKFYIDLGKAIYAFFLAFFESLLGPLTSSRPNSDPNKRRYGSGSDDHRPGRPRPSSGSARIATLRRTGGAACPPASGGG